MVQPSSSAPDLVRPANTNMSLVAASGCPSYRCGARGPKPHTRLYGLSRLTRDEGCVVRTGFFGIKTEARSEHECIRLVSNRVHFEEVEGVLRKVLAVVWVAQKQHEGAALHHDFGCKLHVKTGALSLV